MTYRVPLCHERLKTSTSFPRRTRVRSRCLGPDHFQRNRIRDGIAHPVFDEAKAAFSIELVSRLEPLYPVFFDGDLGASRFIVLEAVDGGTARKRRNCHTTDRHQSVSPVRILGPLLCYFGCC